MMEENPLKVMLLKSLIRILVFGYLAVKVMFLNLKWMVNTWPRIQIPCQSCKQGRGIRAFGDIWYNSCKDPFTTPLSPDHLSLQTGRLTEWIWQAGTSERWWISHYWLYY
ncbi:hypothetical protein EVAR_70492_1 [Eumeta japonica]|uniref:Uncharacterized protein n=1 Tax=Eumeta variegata TaxID=151549 RepID=A0A4C1T6N2_EUMVA|nr:hypothetical protein EVAR_70492_1 [Eumeta japonica]